MGVTPYLSISYAKFNFTKNPKTDYLQSLCNSFPGCSKRIRYDQLQTLKQLKIANFQTIQKITKKINNLPTYITLP